MNIVNLIQGTPEWHAHRAQHFNASDAPAMMGVSPYKTRSELLREMTTGITQEVDAATQRRFDDGHRFEALARPLAEKIIGDELYPVTGTNGKLSASFDGLTLMNDVAFEHKSLNARIREALANGGDGASLPMEYQIQMAQQRLVSGCERILFMASSWADDGALLEELHCWYTPNPDLEQAIVAGWDQFAADLAAYVPEVIAAEVVATPVESLPAVSVRMEGSIAVISNLTLFGDKLKAFVEKIDRNPSTDQAFADAEAAIKTLQTAQDALEQAEAAALAQTSSIEEMRRTVADYAGLARSTRLMLEKVVKARKDQIKVEIVAEGRDSLAEHIAALNQRLGKPYMPTVPADFAGVIKGKKTVASLRDAMSTELARAKIEASAIADRIQINLNTLRDLAKDHSFLFSDTPALVLKDAEHVTVLVKQRIAEHQQAEATRLEAERERIRAEEVARLEREAREAQAKALAEEEAANRERLAREAAANTVAQPPQQVLKAEPATVPAEATDRGQAANESPRGGAMGVEQATAVALAAEPATLKVGDICARLGFTLTAAFISDVLGIQSSGQEKRAVLFKESDFGRICDALVRHITQAKAGEPLAA